MGPIVVDSVNFDPERKKVTPKDVEVAGKLWRAVEGGEGEGLGGGVGEELEGLFGVLKVFYFIFFFILYFYLFIFFSFSFFLSFFLSCSLFLSLFVILIFCFIRKQSLMLGDWH